MATRAPDPLSVELRATIKGQLARGYSTRTLAKKFGLGETSIRDISTGRRGVSPTRAAAAIASFSANREGIIVPIEGGGLVEIDPRTRREWSRLGKYLNAIKQAERTGDYRLVRKLAGGRLTFADAAGNEIALETGPDQLRELGDAGLLGFRDVKFISPKKATKRRRQ